MESGLVTRVEMRSNAPAKRSGPAKLPRHMTPQQLHTLGLAGVRGMNPDAKHPEMSPSGPTTATVYVLGEAPGEHEDASGKPFAGPHGEFLRHRLPGGWQRITRLNNVVRTLPRENKPASRVQIECFRPSLVADIERTKPKVILGVGALACDWAIGTVNGGLPAARGRKFAVRIGKHDCWFVPTYHPSLVRRRIKEDEDRSRKRERGEIPGKELERLLRHDVRQAYRYAEHGAPEIEDAAKFEDGVRCVEGGDPEVVEKFLRWAAKQPVTAFDFETNRLRPYLGRGPKPKILTVSVGTYERVMAFAVDHPQATWTPKARKRVLAALEEYFRSKSAKVAHNLPFELEWCMFLYGPDIRRCCTWHCTRAQAYVLDERAEGQSLDFLCMMRYGFNLKSQSVVTTAGLFGQSEDEIDRGKLEATKLLDVLRYNGPDSKYTFKLHMDQRRDLKQQGLWTMYMMHRDRCPSFANAQRIGLPVNPELVKEYETELRTKLKSVEAKIKSDEAVTRYEKQFGTFNPGSDKQKVVLFRDVLKRKQDGKGFKVDEAAMEAMGDLSIARFCLQHKKLSKIKGTYIDRMQLTHPETLVYQDGRLHSSFNLTETATGRTSSDDPNVQNFPKRKERRIRKIVYAPPGYVMLAIDHGQLEYRCAGMSSRDKVIAKYLWQGQDIHGEWAERVAKAAPHTLQKWKDAGAEKPLKALRDQIKNGWVFPRFFGSSWNSIYRNMGITEREGGDLAELFDDIFKGMIKWQRAQYKFYEQHLYVETLTGRRRRAPMNWNMIINHPIQGLGSDIVIDGMNRMDKWSLEMDKPWLSPALNIHDDLTLLVPIKSQDEAIDLASRAMLETARAWSDIITVPLNVEVSAGPNWAETSPVVTLQSDKVIGFPRKAAA